MKPYRLQLCEVESLSDPYLQDVESKFLTDVLCRFYKPAVCFVFSTEASGGLEETLLRFCVEIFWLKENFSGSFIESTVESCVVLWRISLTKHALSRLLDLAYTDTVVK